MLDGRIMGLDVGDKTIGVAVSDLMGIKLLDHIIIGNNNYISLKEKGII